MANSPLIAQRKNALLSPSTNSHYLCSHTGKAPPPQITTASIPMQHHSQHMQCNYTIHPLLFQAPRIFGLLLAVLFTLRRVLPYNLPIPLSQPGRGSVLTPIILLVLSAFLILAVFIARGPHLRFVGLKDPQTILCTRGIYILSRNPIYSACNLFCLALTTQLVSITALLLTIAVITCNHILILAEEKALKAAFPTEYEEYRSKVRRYLFLL